MVKIDCEKIRNETLESVKNEVSKIKANYDQTLKLVVIQVEGDSASDVYIKNKLKTCEEVGIECEHIKLPNDISFNNLSKVIKAANDDYEVTSVLLQLPIPDHLKPYEQELLDLISWEKDCDGLTTKNIGKLWNGQDCIVPATAKGVLKALQGVNLDGVDVCVIGRSNLVGKPLIRLLERFNATVMLCHSKTKDIKTKIALSDIVITAIGQPKYWDCSLFNKKIVIDVSINRDENGKLCGDVNWDNKDNLPKSFDCIYTPVPRGIGALTCSELMDNVVQCYKLQYLM